MAKNKKQRKQENQTDETVVDIEPQQENQTDETLAAPTVADSKNPRFCYVVINGVNVATYK